MSRQLADEIHFCISIRPAVGVENIMMPRVRLTEDRHLPGIPGVFGLRLTVNQSPTIRGDFFLLEDGKNRLKRAAIPAGHELGADKRPSVFAKLADVAIHRLWLAVIVERDH